MITTLWLGPTSRSVPSGGRGEDPEALDRVRKAFIELALKHSIKKEDVEGGTLLHLLPSSEVEGLIKEVHTYASTARIQLEQK